MRLVLKILPLALFTLAIPLIYAEKIESNKTQTQEPLRQNEQERTGGQAQPLDKQFEGLQEYEGLSTKGEARPKFLPEGTKAPKLNQVLFGVYPVAIYDIDLAKDSYRISFYAWWRVNNPDYHPEKSVEITNATHYYSKFGSWGKNGDEYFTYVHYYATMQHDWDIRNFPFDRQCLEVRLEDFADIQSVVFHPDHEQSSLHNEMHLSGWKIVSLKLNDSTTHYKINFGDISTPQGLYSRLSFIVEIKRDGWRLYFDYFCGYFIAVFLCLITCFVDIKAIETRSTLILGAIFGFVGNKYILNAALPPTDEFNLVDIIQIATLVAIVFSVTLNTIFTSPYMDRFNQKHVKRLDHFFAIAGASAYIIVISIFTYQAAIS